MKARHKGGRRERGPFCAAGGLAADVAQAHSLMSLIIIQSIYFVLRRRDYLRYCETGGAGEAVSVWPR